MTHRSSPPIIELSGNLRPMVIMRKLTFGNRSDSGASNEAALMSVVETGVQTLKTDLEPLRFLRKRRAARFSNQTHTRATERTFLENLPVTILMKVKFWD